MFEGGGLAAILNIAMDVPVQNQHNEESRKTSNEVAIVNCEQSISNFAIYFHTMENTRNI